MKTGIYLSVLAAFSVVITQELNLLLFFSKKLKYFPFPARSIFSSLPADLVIAFFALLPLIFAHKNTISIFQAIEFIVNSALIKCVFSIIYSLAIYIIAKRPYQNI